MGFWHVYMGIYGGGAAPTGPKRLCMAAIQLYVPGAESLELYSPGIEAAQTYVPGAEALQTCEK